MGVNHFPKVALNSAAARTEPAWSPIASPTPNHYATEPHWTEDWCWVSIVVNLERSVLTYQGDSIKHLHLANVDTSRIRKISIGASTTRWESTDATRVERSVADSVKHLHVMNVVHKQTVLKAYDQTLESTINTTNGCQKCNCHKHWTFVLHLHFQLSKTCSRHLFSRSYFTNCFQSTSSEHCTALL